MSETKLVYSGEPPLTDYIAFRQGYSDGSGIRLEVEYENKDGKSAIQIKSIEEYNIDIEESDIDFIMGSLQKIKEIIQEHKDRGENL